jgi:hypothetical protein
MEPDATPADGFGRGERVQACTRQSLPQALSMSFQMFWAQPHA